MPAGSTAVLLKSILLVNQIVFAHALLTSA